MTATFDLDRALEAVLEADGPQVAPPSILPAALAAVGTRRQQRPRLHWLDGEAWPGRRIGVPASLDGRPAVVTVVALLILALIATAFAVGVALRREAAPPSPFGGRVIAWVPDGDVGTLHVVDPESGADRAIDLGPVHHCPKAVAGTSFVAAWTPGDTLLAHDVTTGGRTVVIGPGESRSGRAGADYWAPSGTRVALSANRGIPVVDLAAGTNRSLAVDGRVSSLFWMPDGRLAVARQNTPGLAIGQTEVILVDPATDAQQSLARFPWDAAADGNPFIAVALDGRYLLRDEAGMELVVQDLETGTIARYPAAGALPSDLVSPDGQWMAIPDAAGSVAVVGADGMARVALSAGAVVDQLDWAPDGSRLAIATRDSLGTTRVVNVRTDGSGFLTRPVQATDSWQLVWAPDASAFAIWNDHGGRRWDLTVYPADAGEGRLLGSYQSVADGWSCLQWLPKATR